MLQLHPSKWKRGIHVDVAVSCSERRDQRNGTGKMRTHKGRKRRKGGRGESPGTEEERKSIHSSSKEGKV